MALVDMHVKVWQGREGSKAVSLWFGDISPNAYEPFTTLIVEQKAGENIRDVIIRALQDVRLEHFTN